MHLIALLAGTIACRILNYSFVFFHLKNNLLLSTCSTGIYFNSILPVEAKGFSPNLFWKTCLFLFFASVLALDLIAISIGFR